jgi:uncharacterized coiled-coil protein SlyX
MGKMVHESVLSAARNRNRAHEDRIATLEEKLAAAEQRAEEATERVRKLWGESEVYIEQRDHLAEALRDIQSKWHDRNCPDAGNSHDETCEGISTALSTTPPSPSPAEGGDHDRARQAAEDWARKATLDMAGECGPDMANLARCYLALATLPEPAHLPCGGDIASILGETTPPEPEREDNDDPR